MTTMGKTRPSRLTTAKSFARYEAPSATTSTPVRGRANTLSDDMLSSHTSPASPNRAGEPSIFEKQEEGDVQTPSLREMPSSPISPNHLDIQDDLPIELISLSDRFIASLTTAKIYPTPLSIEKLAELFQEFYTQAEGHISTHIQALATKESRGKSPAPSIASRVSSNSKTRSILSSNASREQLRSDKAGSGQQMLTPNEISERRKARRMLDYRRIALEEAVERRICESLYPKLFRHKSCLDEIRDDKLRSKTAALALVGISLKDLGVVFEDLPAEKEAERQAEMLRWITQARTDILAMNDIHHPLGKLQSLASAHQQVVDMLTILRKSSSSADEILPTLIYTLISCPPESIQVISNLYFVQRFRAASKINGEAAYCLTNLEAAITFLENVDLASLRSEEAVEFQSKNNTPAAVENQETEFPFNKGTSRATPPSITAFSALASRPSSSSGNASTMPLSPSHARKLSTLLFQPSANALGAAGDAMRNSADAGLKNISQAMDSSFNLLFGRLRETNVPEPGSTNSNTITIPKTLDEARRLVSPRPLIDEDGNLSEHSSFIEQEESPHEDKIMDMITGKSRERSADSTTSAGRKAAFQQPLSETTSGSPPTSTPLSALDSMRSLGNSLNPLNRFAGVSVMRGFGRSSSSSLAIASSPLAASATSTEAKTNSVSNGTEKLVSATAKVDPPLQRFMSVTDAGELKLAEVQALLDDYQRLARAVGDLKMY